MENPTNFIIVTDTFFPANTSGAIQLRDLALEFVNQGHNITVLVPSDQINEPYVVEELYNIQIVRLSAPTTKNVSMLHRTINEILMPFFMLKNLHTDSLILNKKWTGIIWYSPSIFHGPLIKILKEKCKCRSYLIVRDIFPQWAHYLGLLKKGPTYYFFLAMATFQYSLADIIGIETPGNSIYFEKWAKKYNRRLEVLHNWVGTQKKKPCSFRVSRTSINKRSILVYAGVMGVAQGLDIIVDLAIKMQGNTGIGFLLIGRGSERSRLAQRVDENKLDNLIFADEIASDEIPDLYQQCTVGIISLDRRHKSHNIPGKFMTYLQNGLPVLAITSKGSDLAEMIRKYDVGLVCEDPDINYLEDTTIALIDRIRHDSSVSENCENLWEEKFQVRDKVMQITAAFQSNM